MRSYLAVVRGSFMVGMVYRFGFFFTILGNIVYMGVAYYLWKSIYQGETVLRGLTFNQTYLYVALGSAVFLLLKTYVDWIMSYEIREGLIVTYLIKPVDYQLYTLAACLGSLLMNLIAVTLPTLLMLLFVFKVEIPLGPGLLLFPVSLVLAFLVSFCLDYVVGLIAFYTESTWGVTITKEIIVTLFSGALIPLPFFPEPIEKVLLLLPFQAIYHTPLMMVTKPDLGLETFLAMLAVQALWVAVLFILTRLLFNQAIKVLRVSGG